MHLFNYHLSFKYGGGSVKEHGEVDWQDVLHLMSLCTIRVP